MQTRSSPSVGVLHSLARQAQLQEYQSLPKAVLYERLKEQYNYDRLQRAQKLNLKRSLTAALEGCAEDQPNVLPSDSNSSPPKKRRGGLNKLDPIMFTKIGKHRFQFVRPNGKVIQYNLESLIDYFLTTGDFHEPETRLNFTEADLQRIDELAKEFGLDKPSVLDAKMNVKIFTEKRFQRDALLGLERYASELITEMMELIETDDPDLAEEGEMKLVMAILPIFSDIYRQIISVDGEYAKQCMQHYTSFLKGPPNRPTEDELGFLPLILGFLYQLASGQQMDFGF